MNGSTNFGPHETTEIETGMKEDEQKTPDITYTFCRHAIRSTYMDKSIEAKKKVWFFFINFSFCTMRGYDDKHSTENVL